MDAELRFGPGLTLVTGSNESGKSTTHAALRAGLFGLTAGRRRLRDETLAIDRYRPWSDSRYGVVLDLCAEDGRLLRLQWDFERCRFTLCDAATGADLTAAHGSGTDTQALARDLYGVERDVYLRAGCVDQAELNGIGEPDAVRHAIETVMTNAPADGSAATAVARPESYPRGHGRAEPGPDQAAARGPGRGRAAAGAPRCGDGSARAEVEQAAAGRDAAQSRAKDEAATLHRLESIRDHLRADELRRRLAEAERLAAAEAEASRVLEADADGNGFTPVADMPALRDRLSDLTAERAERAGHRRRRHRPCGRARRPLPLARGTRRDPRARPWRGRAGARGRGGGCSDDGIAAARRPGGRRRRNRHRRSRSGAGHGRRDRRGGGRCGRRRRVGAHRPARHRLTRARSGSAWRRPGGRPAGGVSHVGRARPCAGRHRAGARRDPAAGRGRARPHGRHPPARGRAGRPARARGHRVTRMRHRRARPRRRAAPLRPHPCGGNRPHRGHAHPDKCGRGAAPAAGRRFDRGGPRPAPVAAGTPERPRRTGRRPRPRRRRAGTPPGPHDTRCRPPPRASG